MENMYRLLCGMLKQNLGMRGVFYVGSMWTLFVMLIMLNMVGMVSLFVYGDKSICGNFVFKRGDMVW